MVRAKYGGRANVPDIVKSRMINLGSSSSSKSNMNKQPPLASSQTTISRTNTQTNSNSGNSSSNDRNLSKSNSGAGFNPFLMPLLGATGAAAATTPDLGFMAELLSKMPPGKSKNDIIEKTYFASF